MTDLRLGDVLRCIAKVRWKSGFQSADLGSVIWHDCCDEIARRLIAKSIPPKCRRLTDQQWQTYLILCETVNEDEEET